MSKITLTLDLKRALKYLFITLERWLRNLRKENAFPHSSNEKKLP